MEHSDHDLLINLLAEFRELRTQLFGLSKDHETRIRSMEKDRYRRDGALLIIGMVSSYLIHKLF